jgi:hypothetical protein
MDDRRTVREMSQRRRNEGLSPFEIHTILEGLSLLLRLLMIIIAMPPSIAKAIILAMTTTLFSIINRSTQFIRNHSDPIEPTNKARLVDSFSVEECWDFFRFRKHQLKQIVTLLGLPAHFLCNSGHAAPGEHALCVYLYLHTYPTKLQRMQKEFGREMTQLSRISNRVKSFLLTRHSHKVVANLDWYSDRFDIYANAVNQAIQNSPVNLLPGLIPLELLNIFSFLDGTTELICRITVFNFQL